MRRKTKAAGCERTESMNELYNNPALYDGLFDDMRRDTEFVLEKLTAHLVSPRHRVVELAAGSGRIAAELAASHPDDLSCIAVDISEGMMSRGKRRYARLNNLSWVHGDILDVGTYQLLGRGIYSGVILAANSLAHFIERRQRLIIHRESVRLLECGGIGICAVMTQDSFSDSECGTVFVGTTGTVDGESYDVYETSRRTSDGSQLVRWYFVSDSGEADFENQFHLARFSRGQLADELRQSGALILETASGFEPGEKNWEICVYTCAEKCVD